MRWNKHQDNRTKCLNTSFKNEFTLCEMDHCCFITRFDKSYIMLLLYVNDMLVTVVSIIEINKLKKQVSKDFEIKDLKAAKQIIYMRITWDKSKGAFELS